MKTSVPTDDSPPRPPASRRFTLLDGMILVASASLGLTMIRGLFKPDDLKNIFPAVISEFSWNRHYIEGLAADLVFLVMPLLLAMTLGVLAIRLRRPRPQWRRLVRQPGFVAALVQVLASVVPAVVALTNDDPSHQPTSEHLLAILDTFTEVGSLLGGFAVLVAWTTLLLVGRWRPEAGWIDRLGRVIGMGWIVLSLAAWYGFRNLF